MISTRQPGVSLGADQKSCLYSTTIYTVVVNFFAIVEITQQVSNIVSFYHFRPYAGCYLFQNGIPAKIMEQYTVWLLQH